VEWNVLGADGSRKLQLWWAEHAGPPVEAPSRKGFGSSLIQRLLTTQCRAEIKFDFDRLGLRFQMSVPLVGAGLEELGSLRAGEPAASVQLTDGSNQPWQGGALSSPGPEPCGIRLRLSS
jgi:hypothetical protein